MPNFYVVEKDTRKCSDCHLCAEMAPCMEVEKCNGCGVCYELCPYEAVKLIPRERYREVSIKVNGKVLSVPEGVTIMAALKFLGLNFLDVNEDFMCHVGGCWNCAVKVDGTVKRACITTVKENMDIHLDPNIKPLRTIQRIDAVSSISGKVRVLSGKRLVNVAEVVCIVCGCNLRCPQCFNWTAVYNANGKTLSCEEVAKLIILHSNMVGSEEVAFTGGEPTLNRKWLIGVMREVKRFNKHIGFHVDTNGSILTSEYLDELCSAGMNGITVDVKGCKLETFMRITGLKDKGKAERYLNNAWNSIKYLLDNYVGKVYVGAVIPYNSELISLDEIVEIGKKLADIDNENVRVTIQPYVPEFRRKWLKHPSISEIRHVGKILKDEGIRNIVYQQPLPLIKI